MKRPYILIVEDDQWLAEQHIRTLEAAGFSARFSADTSEAMSLIDEIMPDALLLDVLLPGGNIFPLLHELRSHVDTSTLPIVLCTNSAEQLAKEDMTVYGVSAILDKATMRPEDIVAALKRALP